MKHLFLALFLMSSLASFGQDIFEQGNVHLTFDKMNIDLGEVKKGEQRTTAFTFTNTGNEAIEFEIVDGCECTTLDWPRKAIAPGQSGTIDVIFDSSQKEKSEVIDIDVTLRNVDPETENPIFIFLTYTYQLVP